MSAQNLKYSEAVKRLEEILESIDHSSLGIDELADGVREAAGLIKQCRVILTNTEEGVRAALEGLDGGLGEK
ncbi:hypothetical protein AGMMS49938_09520 [Fibrobacterales bacterium]|nr:hypothetical protein AGMMS49938_09520 [Fibrobacterales bacterium]